MSAVVTRHGGRFDNHEVEIEFDKKLLVLNRIRLLIDGQTVDSAHVIYGDRELRAQAPDGTPVSVIISSDMVGELVRAQIRRPDDSLHDLREPATDRPLALAMAIAIASLVLLTFAIIYI